MKQISILLLVILSTNIYSQMPLVDGEIVYEGVIESEEFNKDQLYVFLNIFLAEHLDRSQKSKEYSDKEAGIIAGSAQFDIYTKNKYSKTPYPSTITFDYLLAVKEGKLKYKFSRFEQAYILNSQLDVGALEKKELPKFIRADVWELIKKDADAEIVNLIQLISMDLSKYSSFIDW